jgi:hypothetical protein
MWCVGISDTPLDTVQWKGKHRKHLQNTTTTMSSALMNDAAYKFKRYEDASLEYIGINKHEGEGVGLYGTVLSSEDYQGSFENVSI